MPLLVFEIAVALLATACVILPTLVDNPAYALFHVPTLLLTAAGIVTLHVPSVFAT